MSDRVISDLLNECSKFRMFRAYKIYYTSLINLILHGHEFDILFIPCIILRHFYIKTKPEKRAFVTSSLCNSSFAYGALPF